MIKLFEVLDIENMFNSGIRLLVVTGLPRFPDLVVRLHDMPYSYYYFDSDYVD